MVRSGLIGLVFLVWMLAGFATNVQAEDMQWRDETVTTEFFESDVKVVLKQILQRNGMEVFFRPGVEGNVTLKFTDFPLKAAFNKIKEENGLAYSYDESTNTVTMFKADSQAFVDDLFVPQHSDLKDIMRALDRFGLLDGSVNIQPDYKTNALFLKGPQSLVGDMVKLSTQIDAAYRSKKEAELAAWQRDLEKQTIDQSIEDTHVIVKVITLRYANVGASTTTFQGKSVTIPGILDSLKAFVGSIEVRDVNSEGRDDKKTKQVVSLQNKPVVSIDQRTNSVIVQGSESQVKRIEDVIKELDRPVPLVEIEVMIVNGQDNLSKQLGVRWGVNRTFAQNARNLSTATNVVSSGTVNQIGLNASQATAATNTVTSLTSGLTSTSTAATTNSVANSGVAQLAVTASGLGAGFIFQGTRALLDATLSALAANDQLQTIASPRVVTLNNLEAKITNSSNINFVVTTGDGTKSGIETVSTGVTLEITPSVILDNEDSDIDLVRLDINAENSTLGTVSTSSAQTDEQEIQTNVIIPEGATFVMGGLFNTSRVESESGVPGLRSIPILGRLFKTHSSAEQQRETVFFITPRVYRPEEIKMSLAARQVRAYVRAQEDKLNLSSNVIQTTSPLLDLSLDHSEDE